MRNDIRFLRRGRVMTLREVAPTATLLDHLRLTERATGTKEGCAEGDCGACTVVLRRRRGDALVYEPVNSCILFTGQADGAEVITVEDLAADGVLHPVQQAMVDHHGAQCGFCTPGIVMSLFALAHAGGAADGAAVRNQLAGNLCRCTGYRPIIDAARAACDGRPDRFHETEAQTAATLATFDRDGLSVGDDGRFFAAPATLDEAAALAAAHPDATIVAGATDVGLWVTKGLQTIDKLIWLGRVDGFDRIERHDDRLVIGAGATYAQAAPALAAIDPDLGELVRRIGGVQVRASGTLGGNIANGSPIGDTPPALIALGATLHLRHGTHARSLPLESFFLDYRKQDRRPGELVVAVSVETLANDDHFRCFKLSKRFDQDISSVLMAIRLSLAGQRISSVRLAYGGMAGVPKRAYRAEAALIDAAIDDGAAWQPALEALGADFAPLDDHRASAAYRLAGARALLAKALIEIAGADTGATRLVGHREQRHAAE